MTTNTCSGGGRRLSAEGSGGQQAGRAIEGNCQRLAATLARRILRHFQDNPPDPAPAGNAAASHLLSEREIEVLGLPAKGMNRTDIGRLLGISVNTAAVHVKSIYRKLNVSGRQ